MSFFKLVVEESTTLAGNCPAVKKDRTQKVLAAVVAGSLLVAAPRL